jgi:hypothetical protein
MTDMREEIIQCLLATQGQSEGVTADAIISLFARTGGEVEAVADHIESKADLIAEKHGTYLPEIYGISFKDSRHEDDYDLLNALAEEIRERFADGFPAPATAVPDGWMLLPIEVWSFLLGIGELDGLHFGETREGLGKFWWRVVIRDLLTATPQPVGESEKARTLSNSRAPDKSKGEGIPDCVSAVSLDEETLNKALNTLRTNVRAQTGDVRHFGLYDNDAVRDALHTLLSAQPPGVEQ